MIKLMDDVGAPAVVAGINIMLRQSTSDVLGQPISDVAVYGMTALGYLGGHMGWGGRNSDFVKNIGVASAALAMEKAYDALKGESVTSQMAANRGRGVMQRRVATYNAPEFDDVRLSRRAGVGSRILV